MATTSTGSARVLLTPTSGMSGVPDDALEEHGLPPTGNVKKSKTELMEEVAKAAAAAAAAVMPQMTQGMPGVPGMGMPGMGMMPGAPPPPGMVPPPGFPPGFPPGWSSIGAPRPGPGGPPMGPPFGESLDIEIPSSTYTITLFRWSHLSPATHLLSSSFDNNRGCLSSEPFGIC